MTASMPIDRIIARYRRYRRSPLLWLTILAAAGQLVALPLGLSGHHEAAWLVTISTSWPAVAHTLAFALVSGRPSSAGNRDRDQGGCP